MDQRPGASGLKACRLSLNLAWCLARIQETGCLPVVNACLQGGQLRHWASLPPSRAESAPLPVSLPVLRSTAGGATASACCGMAPSGSCLPTRLQPRPAVRAASSEIRAAFRSRVCSLSAKLRAPAIRITVVPARPPPVAACGHCGVVLQLLLMAVPDIVTCLFAAGPLTLAESMCRPCTTGTTPAPQPACGSRCG